MHHLDLGLFHYQVEYTRAFLKDLCGQIVVDEFDIRLSKIPRFPGLKIFGSGLENIKRFTANEYRHMMKQMIFVVEGLTLKYHNSQNIPINEAKKLNQDLVDVYLLWNSMYLMSRRDKFSESDLTTFKVSLFESVFAFSQLVSN